MEEAIFSDPTLSIPTADLEEMKAADVLLQERPSATIWKILSVHLASTVSRHEDVLRPVIFEDITYIVLTFFSVFRKAREVTESFTILRRP